jgi:hypothetical protein
MIIRTYVHTYVRARTYFPPATSLLEGIIMLLIDSFEIVGFDTKLKRFSGL